MKKITYLAVIIISFLSMSLLQANQDDKEKVKFFTTVDNPTEYMNSEFKQAKADNKKVLFVLGGNWCHDSRSLANKLLDESLSNTITDHYRVSMIDVGYLNQAFEFTEKADMKIFYATPTVLIFDPVSGEQINAEDMHIWSEADNLSQQETNTYFGKYAEVESKYSAKNSQDILSEGQLLKLQELDAFITQQELRIKASYSVVGPLLERVEADDMDDNFRPYWKALAKIRFGLPDDIKSIKQQIKAASDQDLKKIVFPEYAALPWE